jgi:hypothetical protein
VRETKDASILDQISASASNIDGVTPLMWAVDCELPGEAILREIERA